MGRPSGNKDRHHKRQRTNEALRGDEMTSNMDASSSDVDLSLTTINSRTTPGLQQQQHQQQQQFRQTADPLQSRFNSQEGGQAGSTTSTGGEWSTHDYRRQSGLEDNGPTHVPRNPYSVP